MKNAYIIIRESKKHGQQYAQNISISRVSMVWHRDDDKSRIEWTKHLTKAKLFENQSEIPQDVRERCNVTILPVEVKKSYRVSGYKKPLLTYSYKPASCATSIEDAKKEELKETREEIANLEEEIKENRDRIKKVSALTARNVRRYS